MNKLKMKEKIKSLTDSRDGWRNSCLECKAEQIRTPDAASDLTSLVQLTRISNLELNVKTLAAQLAHKEAGGVIA